MYFAKIPEILSYLHFEKEADQNLGHQNVKETINLYCIIKIIDISIPCSSTVQCQMSSIQELCSKLLNIYVFFNLGIRFKFFGSKPLNICVPQFWIEYLRKKNVVLSFICWYNSGIWIQFFGSKLPNSSVPKFWIFISKYEFLSIFYRFI